MYWHQKSRIRWAVFGDCNSFFLHDSTVTRKRRNTIGSLFVSGSSWLTAEGDIRRTFVSHFKRIYSKGPKGDIRLVYSLDLLQGLPKFQTSLGHFWTQSHPISRFIRWPCRLGHIKQLGQTVSILYFATLLGAIWALDYIWSSKVFHHWRDATGYCQVKPHSYPQNLRPMPSRRL